MTSTPGRSARRTTRSTSTTEGISLLQTDQIDDKAWAEVEKAKQTIVDGDVKVPG